MVGDAIHRNAHHLGAALGPFRFQLRHSAELGGANRGEILGVRKKNRPVVADPVMQGHTALVSFHSQVRNRIIDAQAHVGAPLTFVAARLGRTQLISI